MSDKYISRDNLELAIDGLKVGMTPDWNENDKSAVGYIENRPFYTDGDIVHQLDEKYIPDSVARVEDIEDVEEALTSFADSFDESINNLETTLNNKISTNTTNITTNRNSISTLTTKVNKNKKVAMEFKPDTVSMPKTGRWDSIARGKYNFIAIANNYTASSVDGITWVINSQDTAPCNKIIYGNENIYGNGKFIKYSMSNSNMFYSENGSYWTEIDSPFGASGCRLIYGDDKYVGVASTKNNPTAAYSVNGINWTTISVPEDQYWNSIAYGNGNFVVVGCSNVAMYSVGGTDWLSTNMPDNSNTWYSVAYGNGKFVAIGDNNAAAYSTDGINWTATTTATITKSEPILIYANDKFVLLPCDSDNGYYSTDGINWVSMPILKREWRAIAYGDDKFVALSYDTKNANTDELASYSYDGIHWIKGVVQNNEYITDKVKDLILPITKTAQVGQILSVKSVDENGKPTEWEAVDMPSGSTSNTEFILNSSTEGSTKQFKITIDDTGTLIVSEIVAGEAE